MNKITHSALSLILAISSISSFYSFSTFSDLSKEEQWQYMAQEVDTWTDKVGMPIDEGIKETVIILNLLKFTTDNSCEGHIDWGDPYPWVRFISLDSNIKVLTKQKEALTERINKITQENENNQETLEALYQEGGELDLLYGELYKICDETNKIELLERVPLKNLLTKFYKDRSVDPDRMLILNGNLLQSLGSTWQVARNENKRAEKLKEYQEEMRQFTDFLIEHWQHL